MGFLAMALGMYGTKKLVEGASYDMREATMTYDDMLNPQKLCKHLGFRKHNGRYSPKTLNKCLEYLDEHNILTETNKETFTKNFNCMLKEQQKNYEQQEIDSYNYLCNRWYKIKNKPKNTEYLTFKDICVHKPEYDNKIHRLLTETIWKEIAVSSPNITKDKKLNDTYSATWEVRIPLGYKHEAKNIYKSCCKYIEVKK